MKYLDVIRRAQSLTFALGAILLSSAPAILAGAAGSLDPGFDVSATEGQRILAVGVQSDGTIFGRKGGSNGFLRFAADGTPEPTPTFSPAHASIHSLAVQEDDRVLLAGSFTQVNQQNRPGLVRLNADGSLDESFVLPNGGANGQINRIRVLPDGRILVIGTFSLFAGQERRSTAILSANGTLDDSYQPQWSGASDAIMLPDGKVLIAPGWSTTPLVRLHRDGTIDGTFDGSLPSSTVHRLALQPDGKILIRGAFSRMGEEVRDRIARIHPDGSLDFSFVPATSASSREPILVQPDGRILGRNRLVRMNADGSDDETFTGENFWPIEDSAWTADGNIVAALYASSSLNMVGRFLGKSEEPGSGTIRFGFGTYKVGEWEQEARVFVVREGGNSEEVSVNYQTVAGSAQEGTDFEPVSGTLLFLPGEWLKEIRVPVIDNAIPDGNREFSMLVTDPQEGAVLGAMSSTAITIVDDEAPEAAFEWAAGEAVSGEGATEITVTIRRRVSTLGEASVKVSAIDGTAQAGVHFEDPARQLLFADGQIEKTLTIQFIDRDYFEGDLTFELQLTEPENAFLLPLTIQKITRLENNRAGQVDLSFDTGIWQTSPAFSAYAISPSGDLLVMGRGVIGDPLERYLARIGPDGTVLGGLSQFPSFSQAPTINRLLVLPDEKLMIAGNFRIYHEDGERRSLARLQPLGNIDKGFVPGNILRGTAWAAVHDIAMQANGQVIVGGEFTSIGGIAVQNLARLNTDGSLDETFDTRGGPNARVHRVEVLDDGRILVGGIFSNMGDEEAFSIVRLLRNGSVDPEFMTGSGGRLSNHTGINGFTVQPDGKIIVYGRFNSFHGQSLPNVARLLPNGSLDPEFKTAGGPNNQVRHVVVLPDGRIILEGSFNAVGGEPRHGIARLMPDGSLDPSFFLRQAPEGGSITNLFFDPAYGLLVGGTFDYLDGAPRAGLARVETSAASGPGEAPVVGFGFARTVVSQSAPKVDVSVFRSGRELPAAIIPFSIQPGTAAEGNDYLGTQGTVTFAEGEWTTTFPIELLPQESFSGERTFTVTLGVPDAPFELSRQETTVAIFGSYVPEPGRVRMVRAEYLVMESDGIAELAVERIGGSEGEVSVGYQTIDGTALDGEDYQAATGRLTFGDGVVLQTIEVPLINNFVLDGEKMFEVALGDAIGTAVYPGREVAKVLIADEEREGLIDPSFRLAENVHAHVMAMVETGGGSVLTAGFIRKDGQILSRLGLVRPDGSLDPTFEDRGFTGSNLSIGTLLRQPDGKLLVGGRFARYAGELRPNLIRVHPDGTLDESFDAGSSGPLSAEIQAMVLQEDGRVLVGGYFNPNSNQPEQLTLARLNPDGSRDWSFQLSEPLQGSVRALGLTPDGKIYVAGSFNQINGQPRPYVARLHPDGSLDENFQPEAGFQTTHGLAVQPDGKLLLSGVAPINGRRLVRYNQDGSLDPTFEVTIPQLVKAITFQPDGKILVGGSSVVSGIQPKQRIARLHPDGSVDESFDADGLILDQEVRVILLQDDGRAVVGGWFANEIQEDVRGLLRLRAMTPVAGEGQVLAGLPRIQALESSGVIRIPLSRRDGGMEPVSVDFTTADGTARAVIDYEPVSGILEFTPGDLVRYVEVTLLDNTTDDGIRRFSLNLSGEAIAGGQTGVEVEILDDDFAYMIPEADAVTVWESSDEVAVKVWGLLASGGGSSIQFETVDGTALAGEHFEYQSGIIDFAAGDAEAKVTVPLISNNIVNSDLHFHLRFFDPEQGVFREEFSVVTITLRDDDLPGRPDTNFVAYGVDNDVASLTTSVDGSRLFAAGNFLNYNGEPSERFVQLLPNGEVDPQFSPNFEATYRDGTTWRSAVIRAVLPLAGGKTLIAGQISLVNGMPVHGIARLLADGSVDPTFRAGPTRPYWTSISDMLEMPDGKILIVGEFTSYQFEPRHQIARLHPDGELDTTFVPYYGENARFSFLRQRPDGTIFAAGRVQMPSGLVIDGILRLTEDGRVDPAFRGTSTTHQQWDIVDFAPLPDGNVIAVGFFPDGARVVRLDSGGNIDPSFSGPAFTRGNIQALAVQPDGKIWIGGTFEQRFDEEGNQVHDRDHLMRLLPDGSRDPDFENGFRYEPLVQTSVFSLRMLDDGHLLVGGRFETYHGLPFSNVVKIAAMAAYPGAGTIALPYAHFEAREENGSVQIPIIRADGGSEAASIAYSTTDGTATAGLDFEETSGELIFEAGQTVAYLSIPILANDSAPAARSFEIELSNPSTGAILGQTDTATVTIRRNRSPGTFLVSTPAISVSNRADAVDVQIVRIGGSTGQISVQYQTQNGTAWAGRDYISTNGYLTFAPGETIKTVAVPILAPDTATGNRSFAFRIQSVSVGGNIHPHQSSAVILIEDLKRGGIVDPTFDPEEKYTKSVISHLIVLPDGDLLASGAIGSLGQPRFDVGRFRADGSLKTSFVGQLEAYPQAMAVQADGGMLLGREEKLGVPALIRYKPDGTLDASFKINLDHGRTLHVIRVLPDGKFLVAGNFRLIAGEVRKAVARFHPNGDFDHTFAPTGLWGANSSIFDLVVQPDGKIVLAGNFEYKAGWSFRNLVRLNQDGTVDPSFNPPSANGSIVSLVLQPDGRFVVGGYFSQLGSRSSRGVARINADGTFDTSFLVGTGADHDVVCLLLQPDGRILVGGRFKTFNAHSRPGLVRLQRNGAVDPSFDPFAAAETSPTVATLAMADGDRFYASGSFQVETEDYAGQRFSRLFFGEMSPQSEELSFGSLVYNTSRDATEARVWIVRGNPTDDSLAVSYRTNAGSAEAGVDYVHAEEEIIFGPGEAAKEISVPLLEHNGSSENRFFTLSLIHGETTGEDPMTTVLLREDGTKGQIRFSGPLRRVSGGAGFIDIEVLRVGGTSGEASVEVFTEELSAKEGIHFEPITETVVFQEEEKSATVRVPLLRPGVVSNTVLFRVGLRAITGARPVDDWSSMTVAIHYDDSPGAVDVDFDPIALDGEGTPAIVRLNGGDLLVGRTGDFPDHLLWPWRLVRLTANGRLHENPFLPLWLDRRIHILGRQANGQIEIRGDFNRIGNLPVNGEVRLFENLTPDHLFSSDQEKTFGAYRPGALAHQPDGRLITGRNFDGATWEIGRILPDGTPDETFVITEAVRGAIPHMAYGCALVQADGKIVLGGGPGWTNPAIARLHPDGSIDASFDPGDGPSGAVYDMVMQPDGRIIIAGAFTHYDGRAVNRIARIHQDGSLDETFRAGVDGNVGQLLLLPDGKIMAAGYFHNAGGINRPGLVRLFGDEDSVPALVEFDQAVTSIEESDTSLALTVRRSGNIDFLSRVAFGIETETSESGIDFDKVEGTLEFAPGEDTGVISIPIYNSENYRGTRTFTVSLGSPTGGTILGDAGTTQVIISDTEEAPILAWLRTRFSDEELGQPEISGLFADPTGEGVPNLLRYAFGHAEGQSARSVLPVHSFEPYSGLSFLMISFRIPEGRYDLEYIVEAAAGGPEFWYPIDQTENFQRIDNDSDGTLIITIRDDVPIRDAEKRFLRVRVQKR